MATELSLPERIEEAKRVVDLRKMQMLMAALHRDAADIDREDWDGFATRYASSVRELQAIQHYVLNSNSAVAETKRGSTWVQR